MKYRITKWLRQYYNGIVNSIAFYPALIAVVFLLLSFVMLSVDFSEYGKSLKARLDFFSLKDASTARTIIATIAAGILSLTVFSFSMVMILLNQAASNMSNRLLDSMIGNRFQQWVLGFYIGTIVYALFLLSTIRDIDSGVYVPALSVYLLIVLTVADIFLFIYFLHYITQTVKYDTIITRIHHETRNSLEKYCALKDEIPEVTLPKQPAVFSHEFISEKAGYFQGFNRKELLKLCQQENWRIRFYYPIGTYILKGVPYLVVQAQQDIRDEQKKQVNVLVDFYNGEPIDSNPYYGFKQLKEVALKALSPGINDPGTAVLSLQALSDLLAYRLNNYPDSAMRDSDGLARILINEISFKEIFEATVHPIWDYGSEDRTLRMEMQKMLDQLLRLARKEQHVAVIRNLLQQVEQEALAEAP